jgi:C1A family cysteine protease
MCTLYSENIAPRIMFHDCPQTDEEVPIRGCQILEVEDAVLGGRRKRQSSFCREFSKTRDKKDIPSALDWRERGAVTLVLNQGKCNSCSAYGTVSTIL